MEKVHARVMTPFSGTLDSRCANRLTWVMPELPEVEVLARRLRPALLGCTVRAVHVRRQRPLGQTTPRALRRALVGKTFCSLERRGKYLLFGLAEAHSDPVTVVGHLGMTGRMYIQPAAALLPKHAVVVLDFANTRFVFEDTRYFGRFTLRCPGLDQLGPEPLSDAFSPAEFHACLRGSRQAIKIKLLDQALVAGIGNIYASEALFQARISPRRASRRLRSEEAQRLWRAIRAVLRRAIAFGSTVPLSLADPAQTGHSSLFYYGVDPAEDGFYEEKLAVYAREGKPCPRCRAPIRRVVQAGRSTFFCPNCQR